MRWDVIALALLSPVPFLALGLASLGPTRDPLFAPALGCALSGFLAELAMMLGLPVNGTVGVLSLFAGAVAASRWRHAGAKLWPALKVWAGFYGYAALTMGLSPFPVVGTWGGDWQVAFHTGQAVASHAMSADPDLLSRPPLFGAATAPLWIFFQGLLAFQFMSIVASASALAVTYVLLRRFRPDATWHWLVPLLISPFFLHNNAAAWAKFLSAALVLAALLDAWDERWVMSSLWIAFAAAAHDSAVIFVPVAIWIAWARTHRWRSAIWLCLLMGAAGAVIAAPIEVWELAKFGVAAKVAANPTVVFRREMPWALKTSLGILSCFVAWDPILCLGRWLSGAHPLAKATVVKESFWLLASWVTSLTGTFTGLLFPFLGPGVWHRVKEWPRLRAWIAVLAIPLFASNALTGYYSPAGTAQAGLVPMSFGLYAWLMSAAPLDPVLLRRFLRRSSIAMAIVGTLPWILLNVPIAMGLRWSARFRHDFALSSEREYADIVNHGLESLGLVAFPWFPLLLAVVMAAVVLRGRARVTRVAAA